MPAGDGDFQEGLRRLRELARGQNGDNEMEEEEEEASIMEGEAEEWLRKNIREDLHQNLRKKMDGARLVADIEHDPADYDTRDCCDGSRGNKATFVVSCSKNIISMLLRSSCPTTCSPAASSAACSPAPSGTSTSSASAEAWCQGDPVATW